MFLIFQKAFYLLYKPPVHKDNLLIIKNKCCIDYFLHKLIPFIIYFIIVYMYIQCQLFIMLKNIKICDKKRELFDPNPNFWTDLKLYGLSSVFYRTQTI